LSIDESLKILHFPAVNVDDFPPGPTSVPEGAERRITMSALLTDLTMELSVTESAKVLSASRPSPPLASVPRRAPVAA
jgi:hypothetical protein